MMNEYILYGTMGCHLCEQAHEIVTLGAGIAEEKLLYIDIANNESLLDQYELTIPVLLHNRSKAELPWPFTAKEVIAFKHHCAHPSQ